MSRVQFCLRPQLVLEPAALEERFTVECRLLITTCREGAWLEVMRASLGLVPLGLILTITTIAYS